MRYEKKKPFEMVHIDVRYAGNLKGQGRVYQFTAIDDATRVVYVELYRKKTASNSLSFLEHAMEISKGRIQSILTDNGLEFTNIRGAPDSHNIDKFCLKNHIKHKLTRKRRPQTNGKVERFHRTVGEEFYNRNFYLSLQELGEGLKKYVEYYNKCRPHTDLKGLTPYEKLKELQGKTVSKDFKVSNIYPLYNIFDFCIMYKQRYLFQKAKFSTNSFGAMILTTFDCNFKCEYCIENEVQSTRREDMTDEVSRNIINWFQINIKERRPKVVELIFYGGEPLLNKTPIFDISRSLFESSSEKSFNFSFSISTNGSIGLSSQEMEELKSHGLKFVQVTLDGPEAIHNLRRPYKSGEGSFDDILVNLRKFVEFAAVIVRINIDKGNASKVSELLDLLSNDGLASNISLDFSPRIKSGLAPHFCDANMMPDKTFTDTLKLLLPKARKLGFSVVRRFVEIGPCLLTSESQFVIDPIGDMYKCSGFVGRKEFSVGNVKDHHFKSNFIGFIIMDRWEQCLDCPYVPLYGGGCAYESFVTFGDYTKKLCKKALFFGATMDVLVNSLYNNVKIQEIMREGTWKKS
ncbi:DDE-type integrase/transposase/recombinase [bacterium]|nr:DDE-type integrase/transposase/recombinase [bacterium]